MGFFAKVRNWLLLSIPAALGIAIAIVMRKSPAVQQPEVKEPDMKPADVNVKELEQEQVILADQHKAIEEVLKPTSVPIQPNLSLEDAVAAYNKDKQ